MTASRDSRPVNGAGDANRLDSFLRSALTSDIALEEPSEVTGEVETAGISLAVFEVSDNLLAIPSIALSAIIDPLPISAIPFVRAAACAGFVPFKGAAVPLLDVGRILGLTGACTPCAGKLLILEDNRVRTAIRADRIAGVFCLPVTDLDTRSAHQYCRSRTRLETRPVAVLSTEALTAALQEDRS